MQGICIKGDWRCIFSPAFVYFREWGGGGWPETWSIYGGFRSWAQICRCGYPSPRIPCSSNQETKHGTCLIGSLAKHQGHGQEISRIWWRPESQQIKFGEKPTKSKRIPHKMFQHHALPHTWTPKRNLDCQVAMWQPAVAGDAGESFFPAR